jgi:hypothetical protein
MRYWIVCAIIEFGRSASWPFLAHRRFIADFIFKFLQDPDAAILQFVHLRNHQPPSSDHEA